MTTKTKGIDLGALDDDALIELSRETRQRQDEASRVVSRAQAHERLQGQREAVTAALAAAVDEATYRVASRADPGVPDVGAVA